VLSRPFPLPSASYHPIDIVMPLHRVILPSYGANTSSLPPLHFSATLHPVASRRESKLKC
jgi:hypothetical protein